MDLQLEKKTNDKGFGMSKLELALFNVLTNRVVSNIIFYGGAATTINGIIKDNCPAMIGGMFITLFGYGAKPYF